MNKIEQIILAIDKEIEKGNVEYLTAPEANKLLEEQKLLSDSKNRAGQPLRELLRENLLPVLIPAYLKKGKSHECGFHKRQIFFQMKANVLF